MSASVEAARAVLVGLGLDPDAVAGERARGLLDGADGPALIAALGDLATAEAAALLVQLEPHATARAPRRAIRRALYKLRQRGVAVPDPPPAPAPAARHAADDEPEAFLTAFAGDGDRILWLVRPLPEGGSLVVYAHVHEPRGLLDLSAGEVSRKKEREMRQQLASDSALRLVRTDWRVVDALLVEAEERAGGNDPKRSYRRVRPRVTSEPAGTPAEPVSARVPMPGPDEAAPLVAASAALLAEGDFRTWHPPLEDAAPFVTELQAARESPLVLSRGAEEERVRAVIRHAVATLAPPPVLARRLEGTAYVLAESGRSALARQALAVAGALRERPAAAAEVPFVVGFVERVLGDLLAADSTEREEQRRDALVVTPGQFLKDRASSRPTRTRG